MKNYTLAFWEASDNFTYEKVINISASASDSHINIWYIDYLNSWVTTDKDGMFYFWDLLHHKAVSSYHIFGEAIKKDPVPMKSVDAASKTDQSKKGGYLEGDTSLIDHSIAKKTKLGLSRNDQSHSYIRTKRRDGLDEDGIVHYLLEITEIAYIKLLALSSTDKNIRIWEVSEPGRARIIFCLNLVKGGVHQVRFFNSYQVLLVAGYENSIPIFSITPKYYDLNIVGRLVGHVSIITAMDIIEGTPMVITADDTGCIKTWDVRLCQCFQTIELSNKTIICQLLAMNNLHRVAFIGFRVNFLEFDRYQKNVVQDTRMLIPIKADINLTNEELVVCTNNDVRFVDIHTGKIKKIFAHLIDEEVAEDITVFRLLQKNHRFLMADQKGDIYIFNYNNGEKILRLEGHGLEIKDVKIDNYNKLIVSAGADSQIIIQREKKIEEKPDKLVDAIEEERVENMKVQDTSEIIKKIRKDQNEQPKKSKDQDLEKHIERTLESTGPKSEVLRRILNTHQNTEISVIAVSVYHNLMATASLQNIVYLYEYEFGKYLTSFKLDEGISVTAIEFINGVGIILICTSDGFCYLVELSGKNNKHEFKRFSYIDLNNKSDLQISRNKKMKEMMSREELNPKSTTSLSRLSDSQADGKLPKLDRQIKSTLITTAEANSISANKILVSLSLKGDVKDLEELKKNPHLDTDVISLNNCEVYFALDDGSISIYNLTAALQDRKISKHANTRQNYNPLRMNTEDCVTVIAESKFGLVVTKAELSTMSSLDLCLVTNFFGHKDGLTSISLIKVPDEYLLTTGNDRYVKIISKLGDCICAWNVNHPLPLKWELKFDNLQDAKNKILFALKVIQSIFRRYYNMLYIEGKIFDLKGFIRQYKELSSEEQLKEVFRLTQIPSDSQNKGMRLMADEYMGKDFATGKMKELYRSELAGPTLRQLEAKRKLLLAQEQSKEMDIKIKIHGKKFADQPGDKTISAPKYFDGIKDDNQKVGGEKEKKSDTMKKLMYDFKKVDYFIHKTTNNPDNEREKVWSEIIEDVKRPYLESKKETAAAHHKNTISINSHKRSSEPSKLNFIEYAKQKKLIQEVPHSRLPSNHKQQPDSQDRDSTMSQIIPADFIDFSQEGRLKRQQKATRELNAEKVAFSNALVNLNTTLRHSQYKDFSKRNTSLPSLKSRLDALNSLVPAKGMYQAGNERSKRSSYNLLNFN